MEDNIEDLKNKILNLENKLNSLKSQLQISAEKENLHQSTLSKIKKYIMNMKNHIYHH